MAMASMIRRIRRIIFAFVMYNCHDTWLMFVQAQKTLVDQSQVFLSDNLRSSDVHLRNGVGTQVNTPCQQSACSILISVKL